MKKRLSIIAAGLIILITFLLMGIYILPHILSAIRPKGPIANAIEVYNQSVANISDIRNLTLSIDQTQEISISDDIFTEHSQKALSYVGLGTETMRAKMAETLSYDRHTASIAEVYLDGIAYCTVNGSKFSSQLGVKDYCSRFAPAVLLSASQYESITGVDTGDLYVIDFTQPLGPESWAMDFGARFIDSKGTAYVAHDGQLIKSTYTIIYEYDSARITASYDVEISLSTEDIGLPTDVSDYQMISYLDGPRILERSCGYLLQAKKTTTHYNDSIYFQAFGDLRTQTIDMHTHSESNWSALVDTQISLENDSRVDQNSQLKKTEIFKDNVYYSSVDGSELAANPEITVDDMRTYCQNLLVGTVMLPKYITGAEATETDEKIRITYAAGDAFAALITANACQTLYQDPDLIKNPAQSAITDTLNCYLELNKNTGLPIASGIEYIGTHTMESVSYTLRYKAEQTYDIASQTSLQEIHKAAG